VCYLLAGLGIPLMIKLLGKGSGEKIVAAKSDLNTFIIDSIQGMTEILTYGQVSRQKERLSYLSSALRRLQRKTSILSGLSSALTGFMMNLSMLLILALSIPLVSKGKISGIYLAMLALGAISSYEAVFPLPLAFHYFEQSKAAAKRLDEIISVKQPIQDPTDSSPRPRHYDLKVTDLSFRYSPVEPWVLKGVNLNLPEGGKIAIVGPSGAGKSTVVNLLLRFWDYEQGSIRLGGYELKEYVQAELRNLIGVVTQRTHLFNATIRENLLLAKPDATEQELINAARMAKLHDFILTLPDGYDSYIGEGGFKLSGGQRQRIAIARVLLKNAPILILDEATRGLDPVTQRDVMEQIYELMEGRTTLVITHQLDGLERMDQIIVMDQGEIVKRG
nr:ATP-binding cassette domain-containing protein [Desulfitobacterium hafniense]